MQGGLLGVAPPVQPRKEGERRMGVVSEYLYVNLHPICYFSCISATADVDARTVLFDPLRMRCLNVPFRGTVVNSPAASLATDADADANAAADAWWLVGVTPPGQPCQEGERRMGGWRDVRILALYVPSL